MTLKVNNPTENLEVRRINISTPDSALWGICHIQNSAIINTFDSEAEAEKTLKLWRMAPEMDKALKSVRSDLEDMAILLEEL